MIDDGGLVKFFVNVISSKNNVVSVIFSIDVIEVSVSFSSIFLAETLSAIAFNINKMITKRQSISQFSTIKK